MYIRHGSICKTHPRFFQLRFFPMLYYNSNVLYLIGINIYNNCNVRVELIKIAWTEQAQKAIPGNIIMI